jgi:hypothetical protein
MTILLEKLSPPPPPVPVRQYLFLMHSFCLSYFARFPFPYFFQLASSHISQLREEGCEFSNLEAAPDLPARVSGPTCQFTNSLAFLHGPTGLLASRRHPTYLMRNNANKHMVKHFEFVRPEKTLLYRVLPFGTGSCFHYQINWNWAPTDTSDLPIPISRKK